MIDFDFLVVGHTLDVADINKPFARLIGNAIRSANMAIELTKAGYKIAVVVDFSSEQTTHCEYQGITLISRSNWQQQLSAASKVVFCTTKPEVLAKRHGVDIREIDHPNKILLSCFTSSLVPAERKTFYDSVKLVTVNNHKQVALVTGCGTSTQVKQLDFGAPEINASHFTDYQQLRGLWVGSIRGKGVVRKIIACASAFPQIQFDIVSRLVFSPSEITSLPGNRIEGAVVNLLENPQVPADINKTLASWAGVDWPQNLTFLGGADSDYDEVLARHNIGLDLCESRHQQHDNTKIIDYLAAGMFVITEAYAPSSRYALQHQRGKVAEQFDEAYLQQHLGPAFADLANQDRKQRRRDFMQAYGWPKVCQRFLAML